MITADSLSLLPNAPGVYLMKDAQGNIVYIGKAIDIKKRVTSHCQRRDGSYASPFVEWVEKVDYIITDNEAEALLLEFNLIKKHLPPCNVKLKDDKRYPYIKITTQEDFPRAFLTRVIEADGAQYFGPYAYAAQARRTLAALHEIFPLRTCKYESDRLLTVRPCLDYEMGRCCGPCGEIVTKEEYRHLADGIVKVLRGHHEEVMHIMEEKMLAASDDMRFEKAAFYRDILQSLRQFAEQQKMFTHTVENQDFVGYARVHDVACVAVIRRRNGRVVGSSRHYLDGITHAGTPEILNAFLEQFYAHNVNIPPEIYLPSTIGSQRIHSLEKVLSQFAEKTVHLKIPQRGTKHAMLQLAEKNSRHYAEQQYRKLHGVKQSISESVIALQEALRLEVLPLRIEGYDISNTQGNEAVGAMVVFRDGHPQKSSYRKFRIKGVNQVNDYAMMQEMLRRRFSHASGDEESDKRFAKPPDLIMIDGGKGHLHAALDVLDELNMRHFPICSLAKREEEIYLPGMELPLRLDRRNQGLRLLQQVRDEAHRFGITYHRSLRGKRFTQSFLRMIPGIGPAKERALINHFGSLESIRQASLEDLQQVPGIPENLAQIIHQHLKV